MECTNAISASEIEIEDLDTSAKNISFSSISAIKNIISITLNNNFDKKGQISLLILDRNEKYVIYEQSLTFLDSKHIKIVLDEQCFSSFLDNSKLNHIRLCLLEKNNDSFFLYYLKNTNNLFYNTSINTVKQFENEQELLLYYSAAGLLSIKIVRTNKLPFSTDEDKTIAMNNIDINHIDENRLTFTLSEEILECTAMEVLLLNLNGTTKFDFLKTSHVVGNISDIKKMSSHQFSVNWNLFDICNKTSKDYTNYVIVLNCKYENFSNLIVLGKKDLVPKERFVYDLRSNYHIPFKINDDFVIVPYFSNIGLTLNLTDKKYIYKEQFTSILSTVDVEESTISISIKCRHIIGNYIGFILNDKKGSNELFVSPTTIEENKNFILMSASFNKTNFNVFTGNIEIYCVFEIECKHYYIPIIAGDSTLIRKINKTNSSMDCLGSIITPLLSSRNKLYFKKKYIINPFQKGNRQLKISKLEFPNALELINTLKPTGNIQGEIICIKENVITLNINSDLSDTTNVAVIFLNERDKLSYTQEIDINSWHKRTFDISTKCLEEYIPNKNTSIFRICLLIKQHNNYYYLKLYNQYRADKINTNSFYDRRNRYFPPISSIKFDSELFNVIPYYAMNGVVSLYLAQESLKYMGQFANKFNTIRIHKNFLELSATCWKLPAGKWIGFKLNYRSKIKEDNESYIISCTEVTENDCTVFIKAIVDLRKISLKMIFWDIMCLFEIDGKQYEVKAFCENDKLEKHYEKALCKDYFYYKNDNSILYPYITKTNSVALAHREYYPKHDTSLFRIKERLALNIYQKYKKQLDAKNIYLIYEKYCTAAQDNGYYFFKYCMENKVEEEINGHIYYVIDKKSNDYKNVSKYDDHILDFSSLKHMIYLLAARLYISTDTKEHSYVYRAKGSILLPHILKKEYIFLQHGVIALKKIDHVYANGKFGQCKKFVVSSNFERDIVAREFKYTKEDLIVTGLARWDVLEDKSEGKRKIMIVPTWRSWLDDVENDTFVNSEYFKRYMQLLNDERLYDLLKQYNVTADFYIHIKFKDYIHNFDSRDTSSVRLIVFGEQPLNELMMECKLLITDYSSVSWDIYYQRKPVLFYQFDLSDYMFAHGSYIDLKTELFGDRAEDLDTLFSLLEDYMQNDFELKPKYAAIQENYFKYIDNNNCKRIWDEIKKIHNSEFADK